MAASSKLSRRALLAGGAVALAVGAARELSDDPPVQPIAIREAGLVGTLFLPRRASANPAIVSLGGAAGGVWEAPARALAEAGFPTLALATHNAPGRPAKLRLIPVEYVIEAVEWLRSRVGNARTPVVVRGWSRGGELALLAASLSPAIAGAIAYSCRTYVALEQDNPNGFGDPATLAAFTWRGQPFGGDPLPEHMRFNRLSPCLEDLHGIAVERIAGPIMLVSGSLDTRVAGTTADFSCDQAMRRLDLFKSPRPRTHLHYPDAGHDIADPPPFVGTTEGGGSRSGNSAAVAGSWPRTLEWLHMLALAH